MSARNVYRKHGISDPTFYIWLHLEKRVAAATTIFSLHGVHSHLMSVRNAPSI